MGGVPARFSIGVEGRRESLWPRSLGLAGAMVALAVAGTCIMTTVAPALESDARTATIMQPVGFADIVEKVKPAVISVRVRIGAVKRTRAMLDRLLRRFNPDDAPDEGQSPRGRNAVTGQGSGFFISADGYAVTNFHVVEHADRVDVTTDDGRNLPARVIGTDERSDVALIKVDGAGTVPFVTFAEKSPRIGDWVIAVGNPFGLGGSVTAGIVSARGRDIGSGPYDDFLQIDAAVNRGNSGGPTFDIDGHVAGVNTAIVTPTGGSVGIAFAIPAEIVKPVVAQLRDAGKVTRGWIGVQIQEVTPDIASDLGLKAVAGALVAEPQAGAPAAKAGIEPGDVIVSINGKSAHDSREVARTISNLPPGSTAAVAVVRNGEEKTFNVVLGNLADQHETKTNPATTKQKGTSIPRLGMLVAPGAGGVVVTGVDPEGIAAEQGLARGDIILQAAGRKVATVVDLRNAMDAAQKAGKQTVLMRVKSSDGVKFVTVPVDRG